MAPPLIEGPPGPGTPRQALWRRLVWFFGLALAGALATAFAAFSLAALLPSG